MLTEYLERAIEFEKLAASEENEAFKFTAVEAGGRLSAACG
jgi:hypothetical protein